MKEFDFEQSIKKTIKQLKAELKLYKSQLSNEFRTTEDNKQKPVELHQIRELLTTPAEFILVFHIEDTGLVHAIPLTKFINLTTSYLRIHIKDLTLSPMPYYVYLNEDVLKKISLPIAIVKPETVEKVIEEVEKIPATSNIEPINKFIKLVWKRYEQLTIASLLYGAIKREEFDN